MSDRYYTGTFEITEYAGRQRGEETRVATLLFVNVHPVVYETCYPGLSEKPPVLLNHAEIDDAQAEGIIAAYNAMGRLSKVITLDGLDRALRGRADDAIERKEATVNYHVSKAEALEAYAEATGNALAVTGPKR